MPIRTLNLAECDGGYEFLLGALETVSIRDVEFYLRKHGWEKKRKYEELNVQVWERTPVGGKGGHTGVPLHEEGSDYARRIGDVISDLSLVEGRPKYRIWVEIVDRSPRVVLPNVVAELKYVARTFLGEDWEIVGSELLPVEGLDGSFSLKIVVREKT